MSPRRPVLARVVLGGCLVFETVWLELGVNASGRREMLQHELVALVVAAVAVLALAYAAFSVRAAVLVIVGAGIAVQCAAMTGPPRSSDDVYRYVFDGKVQLAGTDPYRYAPDAAAVARFRTPPLFTERPVTCDWPLADGVCSSVNRPGVRTIYPPVAEAAFAAARLGSLGRTDSPRPLQVLAGLSALAVTLLLALSAVRHGSALWPVAVWAWCPVTAVELGNNAHIDGLAVAFSVAGLMAAQQQRSRRAGLLVGAAILTKLYPALLVVVLLRSRRLPRLLAAAALLAVLSYLPHVTAVGLDVLGYLPGYLREENYTNGSRFRLLGMFAASIRTPVAAVLLVLVAAWAAYSADPVRPERTAAWFVAAVLLITTPAQTWYVLLLLALIAMSGQLQWLPICLAPTVAELTDIHFRDPPAVATICYCCALAATVGILALRRSLRLRAARVGAVPQVAMS